MLPYLSACQSLSKCTTQGKHFSITQHRRLQFPHLPWVMCSSLTSRVMQLQLCMWCHGASPVAQTVKNLPAMQETRVQSLGQEDLLEKGMATPSSYSPWGHKESDRTE